jgi:hypothetical protein
MFKHPNKVFKPNLALYMKKNLETKLNSSSSSVIVIFSLFHSTIYTRKKKFKLCNFSFLLKYFAIE